MKILIVEDSKEVIKLLSFALKKWGHTPTIAETGKEAVNIVQSEMFDLILLDIYLPDAMGYDLIPIFKDQWSGMKIITMTGHSSIEIEEKIRKQGILFYMVKPVNLEELKSILNHMQKSVSITD